MGKVILVLDGMPKDCSCCPAHFLDIPNNTHHQWWCGAILKTLENKKRPDWCPLVELPEKLEGNDSVYY